MMMDCPRCNFNQPKDRFCANCGLNIENFKPKKKPFLKRLWGDSRSQITVFIFILSFTFGFFYLKNKEKMNDFLNSNSAIKTNDFSTTYNEKQNESIKKLKPLKLKSKTSKSLTAKSSDESHNPGIIETKKGSHLKTQPTQLKISFAEVYKEHFQMFFNKGEQLNLEIKGNLFYSDDKLSSFLNNAESKQQLSPLSSVKSLKLSINKASYFPYTFKSDFSDEENGLSLEILIKTLSEDSVSFELKAQVFLEQEDSTAYILSVQEDFNLKIGEILLLTEFIPQQNNFKTEVVDSLSRGPLKILRSQDFKNQNSQIFLFMQAQP